MTKTAHKKSLAGLAVVGVLLAFIIGWWFGHEPGDATAPHDHEITVAAASDTDSAETIWTCSMHPQVRQPEPGKCPICGMDLIPVAADEDPADEADLPRLRVSERSAALMNIQTWPVERRIVEREVRLLGRVNYDETRQRTITAWVPGRLDQLFVKAEGARVQQGDPVAEIYSPALISAQEELLQAIQTARAREREGGPMVQASRERLRLLGLDAGKIREIEERGEVQDHITIHSPLDGVITQRIAVEGMYVEVGDPIAALAALDRVFIDLEAYERDLPWLAEGQMVSFSVEGLAGESFEGRIDQINPFVDRGRRTAQVRVLVENPDGILKPGMFVRGIVFSRLGDPEGVQPWRDEQPLVIPETAALITGRRAVVYVKIPDTDRPAFELRQVTLGPRAGDRFIIREGVSEGELVVTHGNFKIDAELQLRGHPSMMAPPPEHPAEIRAEVEPEELRKKPQPVVSPEEVPEEFGQQLAVLLDRYLELVGALAADDFQSAQTAAGRMLDDLGAIDAELLPEGHLESWRRLHKECEAALNGMIQAGDIERIRELLQPCTTALEVAVISFQADQVQPLYRAYCPMAFDDRGGTWLQRDREIRNPYFGEAMVDCGEILGVLDPERAEG